MTCPKCGHKKKRVGGTAHKREFLTRNWSTAYIIFRDGCVSKFDVTRFVKRAREKIGYSPKTSECDILSSLRRTFFKMRDED